MAQTNVSSCILSIIGSFTSGLDVFKKFRDLRREQEDARPKNLLRRRKTTSVSAHVHEQELKLARSLRQGSEDIGREYSRNVQSMGDQYALGDAIAHVSLADIQLRLNTGLVKIIYNFLSRDGRQDPVSLDYESLLSLSEKSRLDTCRVLRDLYRRIAHLHLPSVSGPVKPSKQTKPSSALSSSRAKQYVHRNRRPSRKPKSHEPTIARVYVSDSSRPSQIAVVKPSKKRSAGKPSSALSRSKSPKAIYNSADTHMNRLPPRYTSHVPQSPPPAYAHRDVADVPATRPPTHARSQHELSRPKAQRSHSTPHARMPIVLQHDPPPAADTIATQSSPQLITWLHSTSDFDRLCPPPAVSPPAPRHNPTHPADIPSPHSRPAAPFRAPIPTYHSAQTASTKLGEIPLHRWAEAWDFDAAEAKNRAAMRSGWPVWGALVEEAEAEGNGSGKKKVGRRRGAAGGGFLGLLWGGRG